MKNQFNPEYKPSINLDFIYKEINIDGNIIQLQIWDIDGSKRFNFLGESFYRNSECCALVFDLNDKKSFENIENWRTEFLNHLNLKDPETFPFILIGNKNDKVSERKVEEYIVKQYCESKSNMRYFETSCKDDINVEAAFEEMEKIAFIRASNGENDFIKYEQLFMEQKLLMKKAKIILNKKLMKFINY